MRFVVKKEIFEELPSACFGVVMAKGIDNNNVCSEIVLDESIQAAMQCFEGRKVKEDPDILPYREAFRALNINPNKYFPCVWRRER
jgi:DNA/RNA-binding domain of Phe-tRNA-synthetase-like protein